MLASTKTSLFSRRRATSIFALALAGFLLFNRMNAKDTPSGVQASSITAKLAQAGSISGNDVKAAPGTKIEIAGYWKEVRASLGLPPLSGVIVTPYAMSASSGGTSNAQPVSRVSGTSEDERHLRRIGRFSPALRRRRQLSTTAEVSQEQEGERGADQVREASSIKSGSQPTMDEWMRDRVPADSDSDSASGTLRSTLDSVSRPEAFPDLFITLDVDETPRTPAHALAASFRAIAVRELKNKGKAGRAHDRRRKQLLR